MTVKERLYKFIDSIESNPSQFEKDCGISNGYVKNIRKSIGEDVLSKILKKYPQLNKIWLLHGEGQMLLNSIIPSNTTDEETVQAATVKMLFHEMAKLKAKVFSLSYEDCIVELKQNTIPIIEDILKERANKEVAKPG